MSDQADDENDVSADRSPVQAEQWFEETVRRVPFVQINDTQLAYAIDKKFFRMVILFAGWTLILSVGGMLLLAANDKPIPEGIVAVASGIIGLLTGTFAARGGKL